MSTELTKPSDAIFALLRKRWGSVEVEKPTVAGTEIRRVPSAIKRLNQDVTPEVWQQLRVCVNERTAPIYAALIEAGTFEAEKAVQVEMVVKKIATASIRPAKFEDVEGCQTPSVAAMRKYGRNPEAPFFAALKAESKKFGRMLDMDDELLKEVAAEICRNYPTMTVADLVLCLRRMMLAKVYNVSYANMVRALEEYQEEKLEWAERRATEQYEQHKGSQEREKGLVSSTWVGNFHMSKFEENLREILLMPKNGAL